MKLTVDVLSEGDQEFLDALFDVWQRKRPRNVLRSNYYEGRNRLRDLGIAIPPQLKSLDTVLGWPQKAVSALAVRSKFEAVVSDVSDDPFNINSVLRANSFDIELSQGIVSAYKHSCSFLSLSAGGRGEPEYVIIPRSAEWSSALWNKRRRRIEAALFIVDIDSFGNVSEFVMYLPGRVVSCLRDGNGWAVEEQKYSLDMPLVVPLVHDPQLDRPFGSSRISRPVMAITNAAMRTIARTETHAEFYAYPQRWAMGVPEEAFDMGKWESIMGSMLMMTNDQEGKRPEVGQFAQTSMQPHTDMLRELAARFAGETDLPLSTLGIVHDNPASAEAIYAASEPLVVKAEYQNKVFGRAILQLSQMMVMLREGWDTPSSELTSLDTVWKNPAQPSIVSASDAVLKQVSAMPWLAESPVILEKLNYSAGDITRLERDKKRAESGNILDRLLND